MGEGRVVEPPDEHLLVARPHHVGVAAVGHEQEARLERASAGPDREVALVRLHGGDHDPVGQIEVAAVETALEHDRPLNQVDDLLELRARVGPGPCGVEAGDDRPRRSPASAITRTARRSSR